MPFLFLMIQSFQISGGCLCRGRLFLHERRLCVRAESSLRIRQFCLRKHDRPALRTWALTVAVSARTGRRKSTERLTVETRIAFRS